MKILRNPMFSAEGGRKFWSAWQVFEGFFQENDENIVKIVGFVCFFRSSQANLVSARHFRKPARILDGKKSAWSA